MRYMEYILPTKLSCKCLSFVCTFPLFLYHFEENELVIKKAHSLHGIALYSCIMQIGTPTNFHFHIINIMCLENCTVEHIPLHEHFSFTPFPLLVPLIIFLARIMSCSYLMKTYKECETRQEECKASAN